MRVLIINAHEKTGGAARAANRLHQGLLAEGLETKMLVQEKSSDDQTIIGPVSGSEKIASIIRPYLDAMPVKFYKRRTGSIFCPALLPGRILKRIKAEAPDVVNLHWVLDGMIRIETLAKLNEPIIWTLHDAWAFTGGCVYPMDCVEYQNRCGNCPELGSKRGMDLSRWILNRKHRAWEGLDMLIVTPSRWLAEIARSSSLLSKFRIEVIPYGLDLNVFRPVEKNEARDLLGLPKDSKIVLFGAVTSTSDKRKGFAFLSEALNILKDKPVSEDIQLVVFGASGPGNVENPHLPVIYLGTLNDDLSLSLLYSAADIFVAPSIQDNLPNTVMEAAACGTPSVAFDIGGMPDLIKHMETGFLVKEMTSAGLAEGIEWVFAEKDRSFNLGLAAREKAEKEYSCQMAASRYVELYEEVVLENKEKAI